MPDFAKKPKISHFLTPPLVNFRPFRQTNRIRSSPSRSAPRRCPIRPAIAASYRAFPPKCIQSHAPIYFISKSTRSHHVSATSHAFTPKGSIFDPRPRRPPIGIPDNAASARATRAISLQIPVIHTALSTHVHNRRFEPHLG